MKNTRLPVTRPLSTCMLEHLTKACQVRSASRHSHLSDWSELEGQKRREANSLEVLKRGPYREAISLVWQKGCPYQPMSYKWRMVLQRDAIDFNYFWSQLKISWQQFQLMKGSFGLSWSQFQFDLVQSLFFSLLLSMDLQCSILTTYIPPKYLLCLIWSTVQFPNAFISQFVIQPEFKLVALFFRGMHSGTWPYISHCGTTMQDPAQ